MFSVDQRDSVLQRVLRLTEEDGHVVAAAEVGSLACLFASKRLKAPVFVW
jgi:hypothetical protein